MTTTSSSVRSWRREAALIFFSLGLAALGSGKFAFAGEADTFIASGTVKYRAKDYPGAIVEYTKAIEADPKSTNALCYRGLSKSFQGDWKGCLDDINAALALEPKNFELLSTRAYTHLHLHEFPAAEADFKEMELLDAKLAEQSKLRAAQGILSRARSKSATGNQLAAIADYDIVIAMYPKLGIAYHERGGANSDLKKYKEAIADYDLAIKFDAGHNQFGDSYALRAKAKKALGDTAGAAADEAEAEKKMSK